MFFKEFNHFFKDEVKQEAFDAVTGEELPIDHAYTMDEMKDITYSNDDLDDDGNPVEEYEEDLCISYAMGVDESILDLQIDGFDIKEDDGDYFVTFDWSNREIWEKYITEHMKDTYWNEYIHLSDLETVFIIKDNGEISRVVNHEFSDDPELLETCNRLCEGDFSSIKELIFSNDYYREYLDDIVQESKNKTDIPMKKVSILYKRWCVDNGEQYEKIAKFWDIVERYVNCDHLQGYGTAWTSDNGGYFTYGIIFKNGTIPKELISAVKKDFPDMKVSNTYSVPSKYDQTFDGKTKDIDALYDKIWGKGPLAYELEECRSDGTCSIHVIYKADVVQESKMPAKKRNKLKNKDFGLVYKDKKGKTIRKYPLNDKAHVASAARLFGHCPDKYKKRLARKILRKAHEFGMDTSGWDTVNKAAKD